LRRGLHSSTGRSLPRPEGAPLGQSGVIEICPSPEVDSRDGREVGCQQPLLAGGRSAAEASLFQGTYVKECTRVAPNSRSSSRRGRGRIVPLCNRRRKAEDGRKGKQDGWIVSRRSLGELTKKRYQIAQDFRLPARRAKGRIAGLWNPLRNTAGGRKDEQAGNFFDRNRLKAGPRR
jgi:hypothetical protein